MSGTSLTFRTCGSTVPPFALSWPVICEIKIYLLHFILVECVNKSEEAAFCFVWYKIDFDNIGNTYQMVTTASFARTLTTDSSPSFSRKSYTCASLVLDPSVQIRHAISPNLDDRSDQTRISKSHLLYGNMPPYKLKTAPTVFLPRSVLKNDIANIYVT